MKRTFERQNTTSTSIRWHQECFFHGRRGCNGLNVEYNVSFSILKNSKAEKYSCSISRKHSHWLHIRGPNMQRGTKLQAGSFRERRVNSLMFSSSSTSMLVALLWPESSLAPTAPGEQKKRECDSRSKDSGPHAETLQGKFPPTACVRG